ncbi:MAG TPA: hypothetical protein VL550_03720 [Rhodocyclaceae bacterium]|nr:hypothetical protein [Rhodocyclaceae bacterium]
MFFDAIVPSPKRLHRMSVFTHMVPMLLQKKVMTGTLSLSAQLLVQLKQHSERSKTVARKPKLKNLLEIRLYRAWQKAPVDEIQSAGIGEYGASRVCAIRGGCYWCREREIKSLSWAPFNSLLSKELQ